MYDRVKIWVDRSIVGEQFPTIANYLDEANTQTNLQTGEVKTFGSMDGLRVSILTGGFSIVGSLPKFLNGGSNVYPLDIHTTAQAIEKMEDALHADLKQARVTGLEFGHNFMMSDNVAAYLARLGEMPRLGRCQFDPSTVYYRGKGNYYPKVFTFYDKIAEAERRGMRYPDFLKGANVLRYEMKFDGRLSQQLKAPEVNVSTLIQRPFYRDMVQRYQNSYFSISKRKQIRTDAMNGIKTVSDAFEVFVARLINQTDQAQIDGFLEELKRAKVFDGDRKSYSRLKKKLKEIAVKTDFSDRDALTRELDDAIRNVGIYV